MHPDGGVRWISKSRAHHTRDKSGQPMWMHGLSMDVTELKRVDEALDQLNRALRAVMQCSEAVVRAGNEADLFQQICSIMVDVGGYRMAWIGGASNGMRKKWCGPWHSGDTKKVICSLSQ